MTTNDLAYGAYMEFRAEGRDYAGAVIGVAACMGCSYSEAAGRIDGGGGPMCDESFDSLARANVQPERIAAMKANR